MSGEQLERRYRGLLRVLPKPYREARGEELLSVLMEGASEGRRWPELREVFSLTRLGLRVRVRGTGDGAVSGLLQSQGFGEMARRVSLVGTLVLAYAGSLQLSLVVRETQSGWPGHRSWQLLNPFAAHIEYPLVRPQFRVVQLELPVCWVIVLALLAVGWWRSARVMAAVGFLITAALTHDVRSILNGETVLAAVTAAALFAARGRHARAARLPGLVAVAAVAGAAAYVYLGRSRKPLEALTALSGWWVTNTEPAFVGAAALVAVAGIVAYRSVAWAVALAIVAVAGLGPSIAQDAQLQGPTRTTMMMPLLMLACGLVAVAGLAVLKERLSQRSAARRGRLPVR